MLGNKYKKIKINGKVHFHIALLCLGVSVVLSNVCFFSLFPISVRHLNLINLVHMGNPLKIAEELGACKTQSLDSLASKDYFF